MPDLYEDESEVIRALADRLGHDLEPSILIGNIIKMSKVDQKRIAAAKKSWVAELVRRGAHPQTARPQL